MVEKHMLVIGFCRKLLSCNRNRKEERHGQKLLTLGRSDGGTRCVVGCRGRGIGGGGEVVGNLKISRNLKNSSRS